VVPLHSHDENADVKIVNSGHSALITTELIPIADDLGVYYHGGVIKPSSWKIRVPENEQVVLIGYTDPEQIDPHISVGFCSAEGLYDASSDVGDCGGAVIACKDGALVGFHIAGGKLVNRFVPVTPKMVDALKANRPTLTSMNFP